MRRLLFIAVVAAAALVTGDAARGHSGRLDKTGGHWNRRAGTYHYHRHPRNFLAGPLRRPGFLLRGAGLRPWL